MLNIRYMMGTHYRLNHRGMTEKVNVFKILVFKDSPTVVGVEGPHGQETWDMEEFAKTHRRTPEQLWDADYPKNIVTS